MYYAVKINIDISKQNKAYKKLSKMNTYSNLIFHSKRRKKLIELDISKIISICLRSL